MLPRVAISTGGAIKGRSAGAFILGGFGALWMWMAVVNSTAPHRFCGAAIAVIALSLIAASFVLDARAKAFPAPPRDPAVGRMFLLINVAQWLAGGLAVAFLVRTGRVDWAPAAIAFIVGLHFLPLAYMFRSPVQYVTGAALIAASVIFNREFLLAILSAGTTLWLTALVQLVLGFRLAIRAAAP